MPAESYPRYSSRSSPSSRILSQAFGPTYPMMPHMCGAYLQRWANALPAHAVVGERVQDTVRGAGRAARTEGIVARRGRFCRSSRVSPQRWERR